MSLKETLLNDYKAAMKAKDQVAKSTVNMVRAAIKQVEIDSKKELNDSDIIDVVTKQVKQRKDALAEFTKAGRDDLIEEAKAEIEVLMRYLPEQLSLDEIKVIVKEAIEKVGAETVKDMGKIMKEVMPKVKGQADGKTINKVANEILNEEK